MKQTVYDILQERGFIAQATHPEELKKLLAEEKVTLYVGFDPTGDSLHIGHMLPIMAMMHMQQAGHRTIALVGGGTAMVGDPSGKTELRRMLSREELAHNRELIKKQLERFLDLSGEKGKLTDNANWLLQLNYIEFLRNIGVHFSVNRMLTAECFKTRMERGLSFIEFNYMLLQSYDFLHLFREEGCRLQMGGDDQWANILAGTELIRRVESGQAYGLTYNLLTTSDGKKMGKTEAGALWLDPKKTSPHDFFQYWRNVTDDDVRRLLPIYTLLPMKEIRRLQALEDREINKAKEILAFETTKLVHGEKEAAKALSAARALFGGGGGGNDEAVPSVTITKAELEKGIPILELLILTTLVKSKGEARRLIRQGGIYINDEQITTEDLIIDPDFIREGKIALRKGKKTYFNIIVNE